jgi:dipeptidyl aminopeptidase/acylaminoacyl peptidase
VFLPDGQHYLYLRANFTGRDDLNGAYVGTLHSKAATFLAATSSNVAYAEPGYIVYEKDGSLVAQGFDLGTLSVRGEPRLILRDVRYMTVIDLALFDAGRHGTLIAQTGEQSAESRLNLYDRSGKLLGSLGPPGSYSNPSLSPDGTRAAYDQRKGHGGSSIWIEDLRSGSSTELTLNPALNQAPIWTADGQKIVFTSNRKVFNQVFEKNADGSGPESEITEVNLGHMANGWDWSRDGRYMLLRNESELWYYTPADRKVVPYIRGKWLVRNGQFSPNGRYAACSSNETGRWEVYVSPFPDPTSTWRVSHDGGEEPRWGADGKELFYLSPDGKLMASTVIADGRFEAGPPTMLFQTRGRQKISSQDVFTYAVSGRGDSFLFNTVTEVREAPPLSIVLNWAADLER